MPIDKPEATAAMNTRRTFLARAAMGGAFVATAGSVLSALPAAAQEEPDGAQAGAAAPPSAITDAPFLLMAAQIELAAVQAYQTPLENRSGLDSDVADAFALFQAHHSEAKAALTALMDAETAGIELVPNADVLAAAGSVGTDATGAATALADLEEKIAATYLWAIGGLEDSTTARVAAQVMAGEQQHVAALRRIAEADVASIAPGMITTDGAMTSALDDAASQIEAAAAPATTTTEEGGN